MTARTDGNARLEDARVFLEAAEIINSLNDAESYADVIATLAVHAGIAASDAFCLLAFGQHSKSENYAEAVNVSHESVVRVGRGDRGRLGLRGCTQAAGPYWKYSQSFHVRRDFWKNL